MPRTGKKARLAVAAVLADTISTGALRDALRRKKREKKVLADTALPEPSPQKAKKGKGETAVSTNAS